MSASPRINWGMVTSTENRIPGEPLITPSKRKSKHMELAIYDFKPLSIGETQRLILAEWKNFIKRFFFKPHKVPYKKSHRIGSFKENQSLTSNKLSSTTKNK